MGNATKPKDPLRPEPGEANAIVAKDEVYYRHPSGGRIRHGLVTHSGRDGFVARCGAETHRVLHGDYVAHRKRADRAAHVVEQGEDGALAQLDDGRAIFLHGYGVEPPPPEEKKPLKKSLVAELEELEAAGPMLLFKADIKDKPGLSLQTVSLKTGGQSKRWKKTTPDQPAQARQAGAKTPAAPHYPAKNAGETDKGYLKRVKDDLPDPAHLPEDHPRYFNMDGAQVVPMHKLDSTKSDAENARGGRNAPKFMAAAYHGQVAKRDPVSVYEEGGRYKVADGNGTFTGAKKHGWQSLPVKVMPRDQAKAQQAEQAAGDLAKSVYDQKKFADLPLKGAQPVKTRDELEAKGREALEQLRDWLDRGKGIVSKLGFRTMDKSATKLAPEEWDKPGGMLFIAPNKDLAGRGGDKVVKEYGGDWSKLLDVVRCTLAVDNLHDAAETIRTLEEHGMQVLQQPKNKFAKPTAMGYRDLNFVIRMPNGMAAEVQLSVKDMLRAKNEGHHYYEVTRQLEDKYRPQDLAQDPSKWDEADRVAYEANTDKQVETYSSAWKQHVLKHYGGAAMSKSGSISLPNMLLWMG